MRDDQAMRFFLDLRNYSQKEGRVAIFGQGSTTRRWSHWFASGTVVVPECVREVEIVDACRMHLAKLARLTLHVADDFPAWSCPHRALTPEGVQMLSLDLDDLDDALGYGRGFSNIEGYSLEDRLRMLRLRPRRRRNSEPDGFFRTFHANLRTKMHPLRSGEG